LVYVLAQRRMGPLAGALTWTFWLLAPISLRYRPSYLANVTTSALWLLAWWALDHWWETGRRKWLILLASSVAWCTVTRPLTGVVLALPIAVVVLPRLVRRRSWKDFALAAGVAVLAFSILPLANRMTTGTWSELAWTRYSRVYTPYDHPGFGYDSTPPIVTSPEIERVAQLQRPIYQAHTLLRLPAIAWERIRAIWQGTFGGRPVLFLLLAGLGIMYLNGAAVFALGCSLLLVLVHLVYAHPASWTPYYLETIPALAFLPAAGISGAVNVNLRDRWRGILAVVVCLALLSWAIAAARLLSREKSLSRVAHEPYRAFQARLRRILDPSAIVFVRSKPSHPLGQSLVRNVPDLNRAPLWIVHDRGPENQHLLDLSPGRVPYMYDERRRELVPLAPGRRE
jgi:hypothetical protein